MAELVFRVAIPGVADISVFNDTSIEGLPHGAWVINNFPRMLVEARLTVGGQPSETSPSSVHHSQPNALDFLAATVSGVSTVLVPELMLSVQEVPVSLIQSLKEQSAPCQTEEAVLPSVLRDSVEQ